HGQSRAGRESHRGGTHASVGRRAGGALLGDAPATPPARGRRAALGGSNRRGAGVHPGRGHPRGPRRHRPRAGRRAGRDVAEEVAGSWKAEARDFQLPTEALLALVLALVRIQVIQRVLDALAQVAEAFLDVALDLVELALGLPVAVVGRDPADLLHLALGLFDHPLEVLIVHSFPLRGNAVSLPAALRPERA